MIFPTPLFALFFVVVFTLSWLLMPHPRVWKPFMVAASYVFYAAAVPAYVLVLAVSTVVNQVFALLLARLASGPSRARSWLLGGAVAANLGLLGWFKYYGFFIQSVADLLARVGLSAPLPLLQVVLPIGISFFTFQALSYVIDVSRERTEPASLLDFAVYLSFFPHLVAGPIVRAAEFLPQLASPRDPRAIPAARAFQLIALGLVKKVLIADQLAASVVDPVFALPGQHSAPEVALAVYAYAIQIYCDFSAYSEMAIGIALLLGFRFPDNFNAPYSAVSLQDFWRRWHMSLSRWLRDYLYIPLGGNRRGYRRTSVNLALTMLLGGLWHGAAWTFVVWGALHGGGLVAERWWEQRARGRGVPTVPSPTSGLEPGAEPPDHALVHQAYPLEPGPRRGGGVQTVVRPAAALRPDAARTLPVGVSVVVPVAVEGRSEPGQVLARVLRQVVVFHLVCFAWIFFRADSLPTALALIGRLLDVGAWSEPSPLVTAWVVLGVVAGLLVQRVATSSGAGVQRRLARLSPVVQAVLLAVVLLVCLAVVGQGAAAPFIYFQF